MFRKIEHKFLSVFPDAASLVLLGVLVNRVGIGRSGFWVRLGANGGLK
jgi:hypothetical protein